MFEPPHLENPILDWFVKISLWLLAAFIVYLVLCVAVEISGLDKYIPREFYKYMYQYEPPTEDTIPPWRWGF